MFNRTLSEPGYQPGSEEAAWRENASRLAEFAFKYLVNRQDAYGRYRPLEQREQGKCIVERSAVTAELLERHFRGQSKGDLVGLHSVGPDGKSRWVAIDIDNHDGCEEDAAVNEAAAFEIICKAEAAGLKPLLFDSDGSGGFHLWLIFEQPILNEVAYRLARWLIEGSDTEVETFPKRAKYVAGRLGPWLRLPGAHHTKSCYTRVWNGSHWVTGSAAIDLICGNHPTDPRSIPAVVTAPVAGNVNGARQSNSLAIHARNQRLLTKLNRHPIAAELSEWRRAELAFFLQRFNDLRECGNGWMACCPSHPDTKPSLSIDVRRNGLFFVNCFAGCDFEEILQSIDVHPSFLFDDGQPSADDDEATESANQLEKIEPLPSPANPLFGELHRQMVNSIDPAKRQRLAHELGVSPESLIRLQVGWDVSTGSYVFPERNGKCEICGLVRRQNGDKRAVKGSKRGLTIPVGLRLDGKELIVGEGASDVAAALTLGYEAIGTPSLAQGFDDLAIFLRDVDASMAIKFVPDNFPVGKAVERTKALATRLSDYLKRSIEISPLPLEYRDVRDYLNRSVRA